jgi:dUTP pyrophosphatase
MQIKIINQSKHELPTYAKPGDAGMDLRANLETPVSLTPGMRSLIPTGLFIQLPKGYEAQIRSRSGLAYKHGVVVLNSPGTIDSSFRGEIKVLLTNRSSETFIIEDGERIAQMVITQHETVTWLPAETLETTERASGGFGHTGTN